MPPRAKVTREEIVRGAAALVREKGAAALTAKALAQQLHCSTQPIFWVFGNMENVRAAVREAALARFGEYLREPQERASAYLSVGLNYIRFAGEEREFFKLLFMSEDKSDILAAHEEMPYVLDVIGRTEHISGEDARRVYEEMWMLSHGIATMIATGTARFSEPKVRGMLMDVYRGLVGVIREKDSQRGGIQPQER